MTDFGKTGSRMPSATVTRRLFLRGAGATIAGLTLGGRGWAKARLDGPILLGSGANQYECLHDWLTPPDNIKFGDTQGVAQDKKGCIYIAHTVHPTSKSDDAIAVFDENGKFLTSWGSRFKGGAHGLDIRTENGVEYIYHCDTAQRNVVKTTLEGVVLWEKGLPKEAGKYGENNPFIPTNVAFAPNGDFYVADGYGSFWIHQYNLFGNYIRTFGGKGDAPGQVNNPHGLWLDPRGKEPLLAVADRGNRRIQYLTLDGKHVKFVTEGMRQPCHFDFRGDTMLVPDLSSVITLLDADNKVIAQLGDGSPSALRDAPRSQFIPGKFIHPHDAMFLRNGDILVAEWVPIGRITLLRRVKG